MANKTILTPRLCPLKFVTENEFFAENIPYMEIQKKFCQKFQQSDTLRFQFLVPESYLTIAISIVNLVDGLETVVKSLAETELSLSFVDTYLQFQVGESFADYDDGIYFVKIVVQNAAGANSTVYSEPIDVQESHDNTILLSYTHKENDFDVVFFDGEGSRQTWFYLRVDGGFYSSDFTPAAQDVFHTDMDFNVMLINSTPYTTKKITFGDARGIPNYLSDKINRIFSTSSVLIDNVPHSKFDGAKMEPTRSENYPLTGWKLEVIETGDTYLDGATETGIGGISHMGIGIDFIVSPS